MNELLYTIWLSLACKPGGETFSKLIARFETPERIYQTEKYEIKAAIGSRSGDYSRLLSKDLSAAEKILKFCKNKNVGILSYFDLAYPKSLKNIKNPPVLLYYRGVLPDFDNNFFVSVVGTRSITDYGRKHTFAISRDLARAGAIIVSGMATGVDGVAHAGALSSGKPTVAVIGSGIDVCYPSEHQHLARQIVKNGCVMTEYPPGTKPYKYNFPTRNRIVSALSSATVVMEGDAKSGSLITASCAKEQGREVYAFPGNVGNPYSVAPNLLIKDGAKIITNAYDVVEDFEMQAIGQLNVFDLAKDSPVDMHKVLSEYKVSCTAPSDDIFKPKTKKGKVKSDIPDNSEKDLTLIRDNEEAVLRGFGPGISELYKRIPADCDCPTDSLIGGNITLRDVMSGLLTLEVAGFITMLPGDRVKRSIGKK